MNETLLLLSGGPDSVTLAYHLKDQKRKFKGITFLHQPRGSNTDEVEAARFHAGKLGFEHEVIDVSMLVNVYRKNPVYKFSVGGAKDCIPDNYRQAPLSVHLMLMMAAMNAASQDIYSLSWAIHQDDFITITEKEFEKIKYLTCELISDEIGRAFEIETPFRKLYKQDIINLAGTLHVDIQHTVSCFSSFDNTPCGTCIKCVERRNALENNHLHLADVWHEK